MRIRSSIESLAGKLTSNPQCFFSLSSLHNKGISSKQNCEKRETHSQSDLGVGRRERGKMERRRNPGDFESPDAARPPHYSELTLTHMGGQRGRTLHFSQSLSKSHHVPFCRILGRLWRHRQTVGGAFLSSEKCNGSGLRANKLSPPWLTLYDPSPKRVEISLCTIRKTDIS